MRILLFILVSLISTSCAVNSASVSNNINSAQPTPTIQNSNASANSRGLYTDYQYDSALIDKLNAENERFSVVPDEFKSVDFENFKYDFGRLKNGEIERYQDNNRFHGTEMYYFGDVFYVDLTGDEKKEAVVFIGRVTCGGSCDGGAQYIYFYSSLKGKPQFIGSIKTGTRAYGCSLKSFIIKGKQINVEQFGRCMNDTSNNADKLYACKFCVTDETHSVFSVTNNELKRESADILETKTVKIMNAPAIISIND